MLLCHARVLAHEAIFRASAPTTTYGKNDDVPDKDAEDWEPVPYTAEQPVAVVDEECGCGPAKDQSDE